MPDVLEYRLAMAGRNGYVRHLLYRPHVSELVWEDSRERVSLAAVGMDYASSQRDWKPAFPISPSNHSGSFFRNARTSSMPPWTSCGWLAWLQ